MKVISQDGASATLAFRHDEVKPLGGLHLPALLEATGKKYGFAEIPSLEDARTKSATFRNGVFFTENRSIPINGLALFNDAVIVNTTDTADSELIAHDVFNWLVNGFGFRMPSTPMTLTYQSDLVVKFNSNPNDAFPILSEFIAFIQQEMTQGNQRAIRPVQFNGIAFGSDPFGAISSVDFTVMRRAGVPWQEGLYFSKAHMRTASHIRALEMLDKTLTLNQPAI